MAIRAQDLTFVQLCFKLLPTAVRLNQFGDVSTFVVQVIEFKNQRIIFSAECAFALAKVGKDLLLFVSDMLLTISSCLTHTPSWLVGQGQELDKHTSDSDSLGSV
jgi:hypothetical protein